MSQAENEISPKVKAAAASGAVVTAVTLVAALAGVDISIDGEAVAGLTAILTIIQVVSAYLKRDPLREQ